jgi:hypothetical protein
MKSVVIIFIAEKKGGAGEKKISMSLASCFSYSSIPIE